MNQAVSLAPRQKQIAELVARGKTNKEIACELGLSPYTVRNVVVGILHQMGAQRRSQIAYLVGTHEDDS